jgi:hypothetical protein
VTASRIQPVFGGLRSDAEAAAIGEDFIARTLPRERWTHEAHLIAALYVLTGRRDLVAERDLPRLIRSYNAAIGFEDDDGRGYHETITQFHIRAIRHFIARRGADLGLAALCNELIASPLGARDLIFSYYSRETLFSLEAKGRFVQPDLRPLAFNDLPVPAAQPPRREPPAVGKR